MAKIWNDIEIDFDGETYKVRPSIEFINFLESDAGCSLAQLYIRLSKGDMPSGRACEVIAKTLNFAGASVSVEDIFLKTGGGVGRDVTTLVQTILLACMPAPKVEAAAKKPPTKRSRARPKTTKKANSGSSMG